MLNQLLETIIQILTGWLNKFDSHAQHVEDKLDSLDQTASDIETNTEPISDIADNTGSVVTPIQNIKSNTDSIKQSSQTSANNTTAILNNVSTLSTNTGRAAAFAEDCANNTLDIKAKVTTIASDTTQLRADTAELNDMSDKIYEAIKWTLADKYINETESGASPMSFDTDIADNLISCKVGLVAQQSGSGDPSPDNVRPISGYSSMNITFNGSSFSIALGDTYYGGSLDLITGELKVTHYGKIYNGSENWGVYSARNGFYVITDYIVSSLATDSICNLFRVVSVYNDFAIRIADSGSRYYFCNITTNMPNITDLASWTTWLSSNNLTIVSKLVTPLTVQLTAQQLAAIKGVNTITSDTNGDIEVTYKESIKHYLDKQDN